MQTFARLLSFALVLSSPLTALASDYPRVDTDIKAYDDHVTALDAAFAQVPANPQDKEWVKSKLGHMVEVDQYMRKYPNVVYDHGYTDAEKKEFQTQFSPRAQAVDPANTADLKALLRIYPWFKISEFGAQADQNAWLLVQHADQDRAFQKQVLGVLTGLYAQGETKPSNYAYLFDRVAASWSDPAQRTLQRYGTQGTCTGPGAWQPLPDEDPEHLDQRRKDVGLGSEADYIAGFKDICH